MQKQSTEVFRRSVSFCASSELVSIICADDTYNCTNVCIGGVFLKQSIEERTVRLASYIIEQRSTVRSTACHFGISKSTVHKDITERLGRIDPAMLEKIRKLMEINRSERHIRGGEATRKKYAELKFAECDKDARRTL